VAGARAGSPAVVRDRTRPTLDREALEEQHTRKLARAVRDRLRGCAAYTELAAQLQRTACARYHDVTA
jgi:hypothetical protein